MTELSRMLFFSLCFVLLICYKHVCMFYAINKLNWIELLYDLELDKTTFSKTLTLILSLTLLDNTASELLSEKESRVCIIIECRAQTFSNFLLVLHVLFHSENKTIPLLISKCSLALHPKLFIRTSGFFVLFNVILTIFCYNFWRFNMADNFNL